MTDILRSSCSLLLLAQQVTVSASTLFQIREQVSFIAAVSELTISIKAWLREEREKASQEQFADTIAAR